MLAPSATERRDGGAPRRLKVVRVLPQLDFGGVESRITLQSRLHDRDRFELSVVAFHRRGAAAKVINELGVPVFELGVDPSPRNPRATIALMQLLKRLRPDVVHASIAEANVHAIAAASALRVPVVIAEETGMPSHRALARAVFRGLYGLTDAVVGVTQAVCMYVRDVDRAPARKVRLIYNCANPAYFPEPPAPIEPARDGPKVIVTVGRLVPVKNYERFLRAYAQCQHAAGSVVHLVGEGPLRDDLNRLVSGLGLQNRVQFLGFRNDIREILRRAHAFALPSVSEGCSISLIEAMASGVPAIGSDVPGISEVLGPLAREWSAPPDDVPAWSALIDKCLLLDPPRWAEVARQGQLRAYAGFSPQAYMTNVQGLYDELWSKRRKTAVHVAD